MYRLNTTALLAQDKLDVRDKSRANIFNWRGQFTPEFVNYILESFASSTNLVIDPFAGSGTVLQECSSKQLECYGYEINPAAYAMCKFFTLSNLPLAARTVFLSALEEQVVISLGPYKSSPLLNDHPDFRIRYSNLLGFAKDLFSRAPTKEEKVLAVNTMLIAETRIKKTLGATILNAFEYVRKAALAMPYTRKRLQACMADARLIHQYGPTSADVILTSPPYINVFNYHQNHRAVLESMGWDLLRVAPSEIGSNRKNRGNRFRTVVQYCLDMEQALISFWHSLKSDGLMILVVGRESNVRKIAFYNGLLIKEILSGLGGFTEITSYERQFTNRFGLNIREDIIVTRKSASLSSSSHARSVAREHLKVAVGRSSQENRDDLLDVINRISEIEASPMFTRKDLFSKFPHTTPNQRRLARIKA